MTAPVPVPAPGAPGTGGTPPGQVPDGGQPQDTPPAAGTAPGAQDKPARVDFSTLPQAVQDHIAKLNADVADHRVKGTTASNTAKAAQDKLDAVLKAIGLTADGKDQPLTQEQIDAKLDEAADATWRMAVENTVLRDRDVDANELLDSRAFLSTLDDAGLTDRDPNETTFAKDLAAHVKAYVEKHPKYKAQPPGAARSGGDHPGGAGGPRTRPTSLGAAVGNAMRPRP